MADSSRPDITVSELSSIVPRLTRVLADSVYADRCAIFVYSEDQQSTIALFRDGYDDPEHLAHQWTNDLAPRQVPVERFVIDTMQPLHRTGPEDFVEYPLVNPGQEKAEGRLVDLTIPLIWDGQVHGIALIWRKDDPTPFTTDEIRRVMDIGRLTAMTIVFARQYQRERRQSQRLDALVRVARMTATSQSLDSVLEAVADSVRSATGSDVCALYVFDEHDEAVITSVQSGMLPEEMEMFRASSLVPVSDVPSEFTIRRTLESMVIRDFERELAPNSPFGTYAIERKISEILLTPIIWQSQIVGVIYSWFRSPDRTFSIAGIDAGDAIANQAGGLVSRSRLEQSIRRQVTESEALMRIGQAVLKSETINPVLDEISQALEQLIPFSYAYFGMLTPNGESIRVMREWGDRHKPIIGTLIPVGSSISGVSIRERRPVASQRVREDSRAWKNIPHGVPLQSVLSAPLIFDNRVFGNILMARAATYRFSTREEELLELICQQAAVAIERVRAREEIARRATQQAFLAQVGELLVSSENPESLLQRIAQMAAGTLADGVLIGLAGWEYGSLRWVADAFDDPERAEKLHRGLHHLDMEKLRERLEFALVSNRDFSFPISNIWEEHRFLRDFMAGLDVQSMMVIPLYQQDRAPGLMILLSSDEHTSLHDDRVQLGRIVAQRIGDALERQQVKRNHEGLLRVSEALYAESSLERLVRTIAIELEQILPCDQLLFADLIQDERMLRPQVYRFHGVEYPGRPNFPSDGGICGDSIELGQPIMDNQSDLRKTSIYVSDSERIFYRREGESALVSPLIVEDEIVGMLFMNRTGHDRFTRADFETFMLFAGLASAALDRTTLEQNNRELYWASTEVLAAVVDAKDPHTLEHSRHVSAYSRRLAELMELPQPDIERIELAGLLHDVGKLGIPDRVLQKPGRLTDEEFELIKTHPDRGAKILERHPALADLIPMVRHHHEMINGLGYPVGLNGDDIPTGAAIICVADAFDTMTSERTYQARRSVEEALAELERCAGTQFHPELVRRFVDHMRMNPDDSLVDAEDEEPFTL